MTCRPTGPSIQGSGHAAIYRIAGGAPLAIGSRSVFEAIHPSGAPVTTIDQSALDHAGGPGAWSHVREYPFDGTVLQGGPNGPLYVVRSGAPYSIGSAPNGSTPVVIDPEAIAKAGEAGAWRFLRAVPPTKSPPPQESSSPNSATGHAKPSAKPSLAWAGRTAFVHRGRAIAWLHCPPGARPCGGKARIYLRVKDGTKQRGPQHIRRIVIGRGRFRVAPGGRGTMKLKLNRRGRRVASHLGRHSVRVGLAGTGLKNRFVRLRLAHRHRAHRRHRG